MSKVIRTTPWFSGDEKPMADRPGVYERDYSEGQNEMGRLWCWWNGVCFGPGDTNKEEAKEYYYLFGCSLNQNLPWRGVMK